MPESSRPVANFTDEGLVLVSDSANPDAVLTYDLEEWEHFLAGVKAGEFDPEEPQP